MAKARTEAHSPTSHKRILMEEEEVGERAGGRLGVMVKEMK